MMIPIRRGRKTAAGMGLMLVPLLALLGKHRLRATATRVSPMMTPSALGVRRPQSHPEGFCFCSTVHLYSWGAHGQRGKRRSRRGRSSSHLHPRMGVYNPNDELRAVVLRKQHEVKTLLAQHSSEHDPLQMRLRYGASESSYALRSALRRNKAIEDDHLTLVVADIKRRSPTARDLSPRVNAYDDAAEWAAQVHQAGAQAIMINTDGLAWGGSLSDFDNVVAHFKKAKGDAPPVIMKDVIVHPIQMALALEKGAAATVLIACVLGPALKDMLDVATIMGTEAIVEVHTPAECEKALEHGAGVIMVNNWDRITGKLYPNQAYALRHMIPDPILSIAAGGINTIADAAKLSDEGYDAIVLGRGLVAGGGGAGVRGGEVSGPELIRQISDRVGVPRSALGWGLSAEDFDGQVSR